MATDLSPDNLPVHGRERRSSSRASAMSFRLESPRTLCPRDEDAFSYNPSHLPAWYLDQELWNALPKNLQANLAAFQHAGAAVLTGLERVEEHSLDIVNIKGAAAQDNAQREGAVLSLEDSIPSMSKLPPILRNDSITSSQLEAATCASVFTSSPLLSVSDSVSPRPGTPLSEVCTPISPMALAPFDTTRVFFDPSKPTVIRERSFSTPLEPHDAYYMTELSQLRTESLPRLRHSLRKINTNWNEAKRTATFADVQVVEFQNWLAERDCMTATLADKIKALSNAAGLTPNGLGWSGP